MGIVFRQSVKSTIVTLAGAVLGALCSIAYVKVLPIQENGFRTIVFDQAQFLQFAILLGTTGTISTYVQRYAPGVKRKLLQTYAAIVPLAGLALILIPYLLCRTEVIGLYKPADRPLVDKFYFWIPVLILLWSYLFQIESYLGTHHKSAAAAFMREIVIRLVNLVLIALFYFKLISFSVFLTGCILAYGLAIILLVRIARKTEGFGFTRQWNAFNRAEYKELAHFSWYHLLMGVAVIGTPAIGSYMVSVMSVHGFDAVAVYGIATFISSIMVVPFRAMSVAAYPAINLAYSNNDTGKMKELFSRSSVNILIVSMIMTVLIACNLNNAAAMLNKKGYEQMIPLILILMLGKLIDASTGVNTELISMSKYYKFNYRISVLLLLLLILFNYLLIPQYDAIGAAWGFTISIALFNVAKIIFIRKKFGIRSFSRETLLIILSGLVAAAVGYLFPVIRNIFLDAVLRSGCIMAAYTGMMLWLKPSQDLRAYLLSVKNNKSLF